MIYLNKEKKNKILLTAFAGVSLGDYADTLNFLSSDEKRRLRTAGTHCRNVFQSIVNRLRPEQCLSLKNQLRHNELVVVAKSVPPDMYVGFLKSSDDVYTLAEFAISNCCECKQGIKLVDECELRKTLLRLDVPIAREPSCSAECPYSVNEVSD